MLPEIFGITRNEMTATQQTVWRKRGRRTAVRSRQAGGSAVAETKKKLKREYIFTLLGD